MLVIDRSRVVAWMKVQRVKPIAVGVMIVRPKLDGARELGDSTVNISLVLEREPEIVVRIGSLIIQFQRSAERIARFVAPPRQHQRRSTIELRLEQPWIKARRRRERFR